MSSRRPVRNRPRRFFDVTAPRQLEAVFVSEIGFEAVVRKEGIEEANKLRILLNATV